MLALTSSRSAVRSVIRPAARQVAMPKLAAPRQVAVRASTGGDFDDLLIKMADKFEKAENKPVIVGYAVAALSAFIIAEWMIHLPALDVLLGFPVQLVGLLALPYLGVRYLLDGKEVGKDFETYTDTIVKKLPGLDK